MLWGLSMRGSSGLCQEELSHWPDQRARTMSLEHIHSCIMSLITASLLAWDVLLPPLTPCHLSPLHLPLSMPSPWSHVSLTLSVEPSGLVRVQYSETNSIVSKGHKVHWLVKSIRSGVGWLGITFQFHHLLTLWPWESLFSIYLLTIPQFPQK